MSKSSQALGGYIKAAEFFKDEDGERLDKNRVKKDLKKYNKFNKPVVFANSSINGDEQFMIDSSSDDDNKFEEAKVERKFEQRHTQRITPFQYSNKEEFELEKTKIKAMLSQDVGAKKVVKED